MTVRQWGYRTGDGRRFDTLKDATEHAGQVARKTGNIIAVEAARRFPGWRTMTAAQRRNARMERIFDDARRLAK